MPRADEDPGLLCLSDDELRKRHAQASQDVRFSYNDYFSELQRRTQNRHASAIRWLAIVTTVLAAITAFLGVGTLILQFASKN